MIFIKNFFMLLSFAVIFCNCNKKKKEVVVIPAKDTAEVEADNRPRIEKYLETHFYNYEAFKNPDPDFDYKVRIALREGSNTDKIPLSDQVKEKIITIDDVAHSFYYIVAKEGAGDSPKFTDSILASYQGELLDMKKFSVIQNPVWLDLTHLVRGLQNLVPLLKTGIEKPIENPDGTVVFPKDSGVGIFIIPSILGYYNNSREAIPAYSPLVFSMTLYRYEETDHDADGIPSYLEDVNGDNLVSDDDTDNDKLPDYQDNDDDNDGILTKDEYDVNKDGIIDDVDGDGTPDYLDTI